VCKSAKSLLEHGQLERGYLGIAGQPVHLSEAQRQADNRDDASLVVSVTPSSQRSRGRLVGDLLIEFGLATPSVHRRICWICSQATASDARCARILRGPGYLTATVTVGKRPNG
jgi:S1-C subfamily serine protease